MRLLLTDAFAAAAAAGGGGGAAAAGEKNAQKDQKVPNVPSEIRRSQERTEPKSSSQKDSQTTKKTDKDRDKERYRMLLHLIKLQASAAPPGAAENFKQYRTPASLPSKSYMAWWRTRNSKHNLIRTQHVAKEPEKIA